MFFVAKVSKRAGARLVLGASTNVVDKGLWSELKQQKIACVSNTCDKRLYTYGSKKPLKVLGTFSASPESS